MTILTDRQRHTLTFGLILALVGAPAIGCAPSSIEQRTKTVTIHSEPEGAAVYHDGKKIGETPVEHEASYEVKRYENDQQYSVLAGVTAAGGFLASLAIFLSGANQASKYNDQCGIAVYEPPASCDTMSRGAGAKTTGVIGMLGSLALTIPMYQLMKRPKVITEDNPQEFRISMRGHTDEVETLNFPDQRVLTTRLRSPGGPSDGGGSAATAGTASSTAPRANTPRDPAGESVDSFVTVNPQPTAYALVIGVEKYRDLPSPNGAAADAEQVAQMFETSFGVPNDQIRVLTDQEATRSDIQASLDWVRKNVSKHGRIYFYFGGHGAPRPEDKTSYLLPYEASRDNLSYTGLPLEGLVVSLRNSPAREVVAFVDACFSGQGSRSVKRKGTRPIVPTKMLDPEGKAMVYTAAKADQISGPTERGDRGLFTHHLLRAFGTGRADVNGDGQISAAEMEAFVTPRVERDAKEMSRKQTPTMMIGKGIDDPSNLILSWGLPTGGN